MNSRTSIGSAGERAKRRISNLRFAGPTVAWALLGCLVASVLSAQQPAEAPDSLGAVIAELKRQSSVPILLPERLPALAEKTLYAHAKGDADGYEIHLESDPDCDGANVCFLGIFRAKLRGKFSFPEVVKLSETATGRFKPITCGGSCSPPAIQWKYEGVLYTAQLNLRTENEREARKAMIDLAKSALLHGPR